jgi:hypothetical protein
MTAVVRSLALASALLASAIPQARCDSAALVPISGDQEDHLRSYFDRNALPHGSSDATFQNGEMFLLHADTTESLTIAPIQFDTVVNMSGQHMRFDCGVFVLDGKKRAHFARTTPATSALDCMGLDAAGAMPGEGARPRLLFLYEMDGSSSASRSQVAVLTWNNRRQQYEPDWATSRSLTRRLPHPTIDAVRALLAR